MFLGIVKKYHIFSVIREILQYNLLVVRKIFNRKFVKLKLLFSFAQLRYTNESILSILVLVIKYKSQKYVRLSAID
jgi:hypothetical protein